MLWVIAFFVTIAAVMVGIGRWRRASDPLHALDERNRKVWIKENIKLKPVYPSGSLNKDDTTTDPAYSILPGNVNYDGYSVIKDD